jgi:cell wall-associated NlpC family hydrolase
MIGLVPMGGAGGTLIRLGQWLNNDGFEDFEHAFVMLPGNMIIEAEPGGARIVPLRYAGVYWCEGIHGLLDAAAADVAMTAQELKGTPYSWLDYGALFTHRLHVPVPGLRKFIADSGHLICSQLADLLYQRLGAQIFADNRWNGYVTPGALYKRDLELREAR